MPTIEERLAALEKQMAAWIDQQPTTYYTHQYSGEEIDESVGVTQDTVPTLVRPNLLDNAYFENPVDQRGGRISLQGIPVYHDAACTNFMGNQTETAVTCIKSGENYQRIINGQGAGYVKAADVVRGYTGSWLYAIDRWFLGGEPSNIMMITNGGIHISYTTPGWNVIQKLKNVLCKGKTYTFSAVYKSTLPFRLVVTWGDNKYFFNEGSPSTSEWALATITGTVPNDAEIAYEQVTFQPLGVVAGTMDIKAAKLELGPTQTLAHREGDKWMLNEIPDYGEQLRRCQRYCRVYKAGEYLPCIAFAMDDGWYCIAMLPYEMRTVPSTNIGNNISVTLESVLGGTGIDTILENYGTLNGVQILKFSKDGQAFKSSNYFRVKLNADFILTADL